MQQVHPELLGNERNQAPPRWAPQPQSQRSRTSSQNRQVSSNCSPRNTRLELPHPTVERDGKTNLRHVKHVQNIKIGHNKNGLLRNRGELQLECHTACTTGHQSDSFYSSRQPHLLRTTLQFRLRCRTCASPLPSAEILQSSHARLQTQRNLPLVPATLPDADHLGRQSHNRGSKRPK